MVQVNSKQREFKIELNIEKDRLPDIQAAVIDLIQNYNYEEKGNEARETIYWSTGLLTQLVKPEIVKGQIVLLMKLDKYSIAQINKAFIDLIKNFNYEELGHAAKNTMYWAAKLMDAFIPNFED